MSLGMLGCSAHTASSYPREAMCDYTQVHYQCAPPHPPRPPPSTTPSATIPCRPPEANRQQRLNHTTTSAQPPDINTAMRRLPCAQGCIVPYYAHPLPCIHHGFWSTRKGTAVEMNGVNEKLLIQP
ncbi:hypothetical protein IQ07DRAFT_424648 [Pyrenochaeta sp. DS3sAY3a]|nr:hypothetical protein IQ07DRAFT_424648 [Pyrenochaeta sp. DS3sAY3a]